MADFVDVTILGTRGNVECTARGYSRHSGVLVDGTILLDAGERDYLKLRPKHVFITHLHPDHAAIKARDLRQGVEIYAPEASPSLPMIRIIRGTIRVGAYTVTPVPTVHSQRVKSVGYVIEKNGERFLYTSDLVKIEPRFRHLLKGLDFVITEGSFIRSKALSGKIEGPGFRSGTRASRISSGFSAATRTHRHYSLWTWFFKDIVKARAKIQSLGNRVQVTAAYDGMRLISVPQRKESRA